MISQHLTNVFKSALFYSAATAILITSCNTAKKPVPADIEQSIYGAREIFPLVAEHVHGATIVELSNGDLLAAWFQGSGERWADDVCIKGARLKKGKDAWSEPFVMVDVPDFPDINPVMFIDPRGKLWLTWYTVIANQWSTSLLKYRISENYMRDGGPSPNLMHISVSKDKGMSWSMVKDFELPNPGSGADVVTLANGLWVMAYNDGIINRGRQSLAISISANEGQSWDITRHLEVETRTDTIMVEGSYPSIIQGEDGSLHVIYSYHYMNRGEQPRETIKYAHINKAWIMEGDK